MPRRAILATTLLLAAACNSRPHHRQDSYFGFAPFVALRGPTGPTGVDFEPLPPAVYLNVLRVVSVNLSLPLVEIYVFPVTVGWEIGRSRSSRSRHDPAESRPAAPSSAATRPAR